MAERTDRLLLVFTELPVHWFRSIQMLALHSNQTDSLHAILVWLNVRSTDRRVPAEDSSSLNVSFSEPILVIYGTEQVSPEVVKVNSSAGLAFFIRFAYLRFVPPESICMNAEFSGEEEQDLIDAGMCYAAEMKAVEYLARAEQCRFKLSQKLLNKKYEKHYVDRALDYLESKNYLNDVRFASFWLNSRKINRFEGKTKLLAELMSRGISKQDARTALEEFFEDITEEELCRRDYEKCMRAQKDSEKIVRTLLSHGFPYSMVKKVMKGEL